jgi:hypothetical protein
LGKGFITLDVALIALTVPLAVFFAAPSARAERPMLSPEIGTYPEGSTSSGPEKESPKHLEVMVEGLRASPAWSQGHRFTNASFWRLDPGNREILLWYNATHRGPEGWENQELELELEEGITSFLQLDVMVSAARERGRGSWREKGVASKRGSPRKEITAPGR